MLGIGIVSFSLSKVYFGKKLAPLGVIRKAVRLEVSPRRTAIRVASPSGEG